MFKFSKRVKRRARKVVRVGKRAHKYAQKQLRAPVHPVINWWLISISAVSAFLIVNAGIYRLALGDTAPFVDQQVSPTNTAAPLQNPMQPAGQQPLAPLQPMQPAPSSGGSQLAPPLPNASGGGSGAASGPTNNFNFGPPGQSVDSAGQNGPSAQQQEQQQQQMDQQRLQMMKQSLKQFTKEVSRVKSQVQSLQKKGVNVPAELSQAITQVEGMADKVKNAQSADDIEGDMSDFQDAASTIRDWMPRLGRLAQLPQMLKQADKEISKVEKAYTSDSKRVKSAKLDLSDALAAFRQAIDGQKAVLDQAKQLNTSDPEEAMNTLQDDFFGNMDNVWEKDRVIQMAVNVKQGISQMTKEFKDADKTIKTLQKKKIDTADLEPLLTDGKAEFEQLKVLAAQKPIDLESLKDEIERMMEIKQQYSDKLQELTGDTGYALPQQPQGQNFQFNLPSSFMMPPNSTATGSQGGAGQPVQMMPQQNQSQPNYTCRINGVELPGKCEDLQGGSSK
jgi:hypothetical protein